MELVALGACGRKFCVAKVLGGVKSYFSTTTLFVFHGSFPFFNLD